MNVQLTNFYKRTNSTKQPVSFSVTYDCILKEGCSISKPIIMLDIGLLSNPSAYNYARIASFNRYYFITEWEFSNRLWIAYLTTDILASYKTDIYNGYAYVLRCSKYMDGAIIDTFYPAKTSFTEYNSFWGTGPYFSPWTPLLDEGTYVVGIINSDDDSDGAISYYSFTPSQFGTLKNVLLNNADWTDIEVTNPDIGLNLYKSLFNPFQYITTVKWFPCDLGDSGVSYTSINFGWWTLPGIHCKKIDTFFINYSNTFSFSCHPLASTRGTYLNCAPYSKYILYAPPFGEIELDSSLFANATFTNGYGSALCRVTIDLISGNAVLDVEISGSPSVEVQRISAQLSVEIHLAQLSSENTAGQVLGNITNGIMQGAKSVANTISSLFDWDLDKAQEGAETTGYMAEMVADATSVGTIHLAQIGSNGSLAQYYKTFKLVSRHMDIVDDDNTDFGRPYCKNDLLSTLSPGYIITSGAHISTNGLDKERIAVNAMLNGGVFLE